MTSRIVAWLSDATWEAVVDAVAAVVRTRAGDDAGLDADLDSMPGVVLLYVLDSQVSDAVHGAFGGLLGRGSSRHDPGTAVEAAARAAASQVLESAARRLGSPAEAVVRAGRVEREVVSACEGAELLVCARDGDRSALGPHSIGHHTRFVIDHAPCAVLLIWPEAPPGIGSMPPPPDHPTAR